jgi:dTDP-4-amino-4,6-dideoxygalactose transaminase
MARDPGTLYKSPTPVALVAVAEAPPLEAAGAAVRARPAPVLEVVPMSSADITEDDVRAVVAVLRSGRLSLGPAQERFERLVAEYVGADHAVAVSSGTAALHLLVKALGIEPGDEVLVPSFTFAASVNCILYEGATPVFVDVEPDTRNLDPADLEAKITRRTRAILAVDAFGHPAEWDEIERIARKHDLAVIDDACEALGAHYRGRRVGTFGNAATFAFYANKQITTGEGGMIVTRDAAVAKACRSLRNQGRGRMGSWLDFERLGYNYRMDEMSAALGASQMGRVDALLRRRRTAAGVYSRLLEEFDWLAPPQVADHVVVSWFVYAVRLAADVDRELLIARLAEQGIPTRAYFSPVHLQPYIRDMLAGRKLGAKWDWSPGSLPVTEELSKRMLALPFHSNLTEVDVRSVVRALARCAPGCSTR